jgi:hypothetical protein
VTREEIEALGLDRSSEIEIRSRVFWDGFCSNGWPNFRAHNGDLFSIGDSNIISIERAKPELPDGWVAEWSRLRNCWFAFQEDGEELHVGKDGDAWHVSENKKIDIHVANALMKANGWA